MGKEAPGERGPRSGSMSERQKAVWRLATLAALAVVAMGCLTIGREPLLRVLGRLREIGPIPFYGVFALAIAVGVPPSPFLLAAGAAFDLTTNFVGLVFAFSVSLVISYAYANRLFKEPLQRFLDRKAPMLAGCLQERPRTATVLVRLVPGFPYVLQNCLLAAVCRSFAAYFLVSLPPVLFMASLLVLAGRNLLAGNMRSLAVVLAGLFVCGLAGRLFLAARKRRSRVGEDGSVRL